MKTPVSRSAVVIKARAFVVIASAALSSACHKPQEPAPPPPAVQVTEVVQKDVSIYGEWTGSLDGFVNPEIHPQVHGYVLKKVYREGSYVREGDLLFEIDSRQTRAALSQAKGVMASGDATLAKARLDLARSTRLRSRAGEDGHGGPRDACLDGFPCCGFTRCFVRGAVSHVPFLRQPADRCDGNRHSHRHRWGRRDVRPPRRPVPEHRAAADPRADDLHRGRCRHHRAVGRDADRAADVGRPKHAVHAVDQR